MDIDYKRVQGGGGSSDGLSLNLINVSTSARFTIIVESHWYGKKVDMYLEEWGG